MKQNFQNYQQQKIDACILPVFGLEKQVYKHIALKSFFEQKAGPNVLKKKEALSVLKKFFKSRHLQDVHYQKVYSARTISSI